MGKTGQAEPARFKILPDGKMLGAAFVAAGLWPLAGRRGVI